MVLQTNKEGKLLNQMEEIQGRTYLCNDHNKTHEVFVNFDIWEVGDYCYSLQLATRKPRVNTGYGLGELNLFGQLL